MAPDKSKAGRPSVYEVKIKPNLDSIRTMAANGITQTKMRELLGIGVTAWTKARQQHAEFAEVLRAVKIPPIKDHVKDVKALEETMMMLAQGYTRKQIRFINTKDGLEEVEEEVYYPPNFQALRFLLMNWGGYMSEPAAQAQREKEFEHKKTMDEKNSW